MTPGPWWARTRTTGGADPAHAGPSRRGFLGMTAALALGGTGLLTACSGGDSGARVADRHKDGVLRIGVAAAPSNLNPLDSGAEVTRWIAEAVMESLYAYDDQLNSVPLLADGEPQISADQLTWTIRLKTGITWHNGAPFTADDVVATLVHMLDLSAGSEWITYMLGYVQSFEKADDRTVRIVLAKPYGLLRSHLTNLPVTHKDFVTRKDTMMGTGPYKLDTYVPGQSFTMSRFDAYHGGQFRAPFADVPGGAAFKGIEYTVFTDGNTRAISLKQGKIDLITSPAQTTVQKLKEAKELAVTSTVAPLDVLTYVLVAREPFSDENFRKAVAHSMDRDGVLQRVYGGRGTPGQGPIGPGELGHDQALSVYPATPDLAKAKEFLAKATTAKRDFTLTVGASQTARDIAQVLVAGWAKIGLNVRIEQLAGGPWSNKWLSRDYDMLMNTFSSGFTSGPANYLTLAPASSTNVLACGYKNPEVDKAIDTVWQATDPAERTAALRTVDRILAEDAVIFPPLYPELVVAQRTELSPVNPAQLKICRLAPHTLRFTG
ncbi:ABC transporter substrate-binding protein [Yinghuangia seranimata]|uniref:ABC transporter substrate-binding protein n=1 Tax=Yinghuangia seranimata TaxID=408067 RepID=UPI00248CAD98|nr:ABC transporter substrate-binding protein [Yinghuangia seranimata]MDI2125276.1 ABC transporter substrate-binding protein [Yinghuangia seranimata]